MTWRAGRGVKSEDLVWPKCTAYVRPFVASDTPAHLPNIGLHKNHIPMERSSVM